MHSNQRSTHAMHAFRPPTQVFSSVGLHLVWILCGCVQTELDWQLCDLHHAHICRREASCLLDSFHIRCWFTDDILYEKKLIGLWNFWLPSVIVAPNPSGPRISENNCEGPLKYSKCHTVYHPLFMWKELYLFSCFCCVPSPVCAAYVY